MHSINDVHYQYYVYAMIYIQLKFNYKVRAGLFFQASNTTYLPIHSFFS